MNCTATKIWTHWILTKTRQIWGILSNLAQIRSKSLIFRPVWPWNVTDGWHRKTTGNLFHAPISYVSYHSHPWIRVTRDPGILRSEPHGHFFTLCDLGLWQMTLKNNRAPLLCCAKLCASFRSHWWIQTGVTVRKRPNWGKIYFDLCDLDLWPWPLHKYHFCQWQ